MTAKKNVLPDSTTPIPEAKTNKNPSAEENVAAEQTAEKKPSGKNVGSTAAEKIGREILKNNPNLKVVYITSNGQGFYEESDARNHALSLNDKSVIAINREKV